MSTLELATKIENLSAEDYRMVVMLIDRLTNNSGNMATKSADEIVEELMQSVQKSATGYTKSARDVSAKMKAKYAV